MLVKTFNLSILREVLTCRLCMGPCSSAPQGDKMRAMQTCLYCPWQYGRLHF